MGRHAVRQSVSAIVRHGGAPRKSDSGGEQFVLRSRAIGFLLQDDLAVGRSATRLYGALLLGQGGGGSRGVRTISAATPSSRSRRAASARPLGALASPPSRRDAISAWTLDGGRSRTSGLGWCRGPGDHAFGLLFWCLALLIPLC